jgi:hypothetical protein
MFKLLLFLTTLFLCTSCQSKQDYTQLEQKLTILVGENIINEIDSLVILPSVGCGGCISNAMVHLIKNSTSIESMVVIFTKISDRKAFNMTVPQTFIEHPKVYIDETNNIIIPDSISEYPTIIYLKNGKINDISIFAPRLQQP